MLIHRGADGNLYTVLRYDDERDLTAQLKELADDPDVNADSIRVLVDSGKTATVWYKMNERTA